MLSSAHIQLDPEIFREQELGSQLDHAARCRSDSKVQTGCKSMESSFGSCLRFFASKEVMHNNLHLKLSELIDSPEVFCVVEMLCGFMRNEVFLSPITSFFITEFITLKLPLNSVTLIHPVMSNADGPPSRQICICLVLMHPP